MNELSAVLKELRQSAELSQKALAKQLGISRETVMAMERDIGNAMIAAPLTRISQWSKVCATPENKNIRVNIRRYVSRMIEV